MEPSMANMSEGSFFEELVRVFMKLDSPPPTTLPCITYVTLNCNIAIGIPTRLGQLGQFRPCPNCASVAVPTTLTVPLVLQECAPTDITEIMQLCEKPPLLRELYYRFSYHFCNHRIGRKLFMDFFYYAEPNDIHAWTMMRYGVDSVMCNRLVDRPFRRSHVVLRGDVLLDTLRLLNCDVADMAQLVCKSWRRSIDANAGALPVRQFTEVHVITIAPELCGVICRPSSIAFAFRRNVSFDELRLFLRSALKRSRIALLKLEGDIDEYATYGILDALRPSVVVEELRLNFRSQYKAETLTAFCAEAVNVWKTKVLGLYNPLHSQMIFGDAAVTRKLSRLEVSVPTVDCRNELDALLFGNPHLEARLQFAYGNGTFNVRSFPTCMEESFFVHYFDSVFRRLSDDTRDDDFVHVLYIRSIFAFFPKEIDGVPNDVPTYPLAGKGFVQKYAGRVEDDGVKFISYDAGSESKRYKFLWGEQEFKHARLASDYLNYYLITRENEPVSGRNREHRHRFADWTFPVGRKTNWEQRYAAKDWWPEYMRQRATSCRWLHA